MANATYTADAGVLAVLKEYYGNQDVEAILFRNDPVLGKIKKERIGGKYIPLPMISSGSGNVSGDYSFLTTQMGTASLNQYKGFSMQVYPGRLFSAFVLDPLEYLTSEGDIKAFRSVFSIRAMLAMDDLRKVLATCLYRSGRLEQGAVLAFATGAPPASYVDVDPSSAMAVKPNSVIFFAATLDGAARGSTSFIVTKTQTLPNGNVRVYTSTNLTGATSLAAGDIMFLNGGRTAGLSSGTAAITNALCPTGLAEWVPSYFNRTGSSWDTYIGTTFWGVDRSVAPDQLGGWFVQRNAAANETYTAALLRLVKLVRRGGGVPDMIVVNDDDFQVIMNDVLANRTFFQNMGAVSKKSDVSVNQGLTQLSMSFSTSWINLVIDSPYCPKNTAYILDTESIRLYGISNTAPVLDKLPLGNEPGGPSISDGKEVSTQFQFLADDMYTTSPIDTTNGKGLRVDFTFFGNFAVLAPGHNGVCIFN
jgi:hypothetical protein